MKSWSCSGYGALAAEDALLSSTPPQTVMSPQIIPPPDVLEILRYAVITRYLSGKGAKRRRCQWPINPTKWCFFTAAGLVILLYDHILTFASGMWIHLCSFTLLLSKIVKRCHLFGMRLHRSRSMHSFLISTSCRQPSLLLHMVCCIHKCFTSFNIV